MFMKRKVVKIKQGLPLGLDSVPEALPHPHECYRISALKAVLKPGAPMTWRGSNPAFGSRGWSCLVKSPLSAASLVFLALVILFWPEHQLRSDNFVFYFPSTHALLPVQTLANTKYLPLLQILNTVGKVAGLQEKKNTLHVWFGSSQMELRPNESQVRVEKGVLSLAQPVLVANGEWLVPVDFLTTVLPRLTHQTVEYQEGTNRIFLGDIQPASFTVRLDPLANGARLTVQFTEKVAVHTASSNGKWVLFLGEHPIEPVQASYHFQNLYVSNLEFDDQDGLPKLVLTPSASGLNFFPVQAEGGKIFIADVVRPQPEVVPAPPAPPAGQVPAPPALPPEGPGIPVAPTGQLPALPAPHCPSSCSIPATAARRPEDARATACSKRT